ncbi:MAG: tetratricopeptide repeat protein [Gammaproteobacteria bacterium]
MSLIDELKRRNVFRVGVAYVIVAWLLLQVADVVLPTFRSPDWVMQVFTFLLILGFPLALIFAWAFELTPEGIKLEKDVVRSESITHLTGRKFDFAIIGLLAIAVVFLVVDNYVLRDKPAPVIAEQSELPVQPLEKSIAVLPFANRSASEADAFFVDGLHDDLVTHIAKIGSIKTISRTSVMQYRDSNKTIPQIAEELGVATIMEGGVQRAGDTIRINVQLINAATDEHLWAQTYDRQLTVASIFAIQSEIAAAIAEALRATLTPAEQERISRVPTESMAALEAYVRGRQRMATRTSVGFIDAIEHFQRAIALDPNFALAYVGLAITYAIQSAYTGLPPAEQVAKAEAALAQAFALDDGLGEAYALLGAVKQYYRSDYAGAEIAFKRALELSPNYAMAHLWYGGLLSTLGRFEEVMIQFQQAFELEPLSPIIGENLGEALIDAGQYEEGLAQLERVVGLFPTNGSGYYRVGFANWTVFAQLDKAVSWLSQAVKLESGDPNLSALFGLLYLDLGDVARAEYWLKQSVAVGAVRTWPNVGMAMLHTYRDEDGQALQSANRAVQAIPVHGSDPGGRQLALGQVRGAELKAGRAAEARALYQTHYPALLNNNEAVIDYTNYRQAIDLALVLIRTGEQDRADDLLDHSLAFVQGMFRLGFAGYGIADVQIYALQGKTEAALTTLQQAIDEGWRLFWWYYAKHDPNLDSIRNEPEFQIMMEEIRADMAEQLARVQEWVANGELAPIPKSRE